MCLLALFYRVAEDAPVVAGANREEYYARGGEPPRVLDGPVRAVAGVDPVAGGTWFGVNERGLLVAVTNRPKSGGPAVLRSRGLLARELLALPSAAEAVEVASRELGRNRYAGCNLVCADEERAVVLHAGDWLRVRPLPPGLHVLTNGDVNDPADARIGYAAWRLGQRPYAVAADCLAALRELCAYTGPDGPAICLRKQDRGTVSSSLVALRGRRGPSTYLHAQGPPDRTAYVDYSALLLRPGGRADGSPG
jgi:uncharacterized protein with NRDE domain